MSAGQHIRVKRPSGWVAAGMYHHGIDLGDGTVIHFTGSRAKTAHVIRTSIKTFEANGESVVVDYDEIRKLPDTEFGGRKISYRDLVVRSPHEVLYWSFESLGYGGYHPYVNNCEHFATAMMTGQRFSLQSERANDLVYSSRGPMAVPLIEFLRFHNPRAKAKSGLSYVGSIYTGGGGWICEAYTHPFETPPTWLSSPIAQGPWSPIDQKLVAYPLQCAINLYSRSSKDDCYVETYQGFSPAKLNWTKGSGATWILEITDQS